MPPGKLTGLPWGSAPGWAGVDRFDRFVADAPLVHTAGFEGFDDDVGGGGEFEEDFAALFVAVVEGEGLFAPIEHVEHGGAAEFRGGFAGVVAEIPFTAFTSKKTSEQIPGRLVVRRIPDLNPKKNHGQATLFDTWRFHAFFTTAPAAERDTVAADKVHRAHAIIENVHADLKASALAHMPSGVFNANAAWLVCAVMAFNLTRAAATLTNAPGL